MKPRFGAPKKVRERLKKVRGFTVAAKRCGECLFSSERLTDKNRATDIIKNALADDTYFVCHRFSFNGEVRSYTPEAVCCRAFFDAYPTQQIRMAERMRIVKFVDDEGNVVDA